MISPDGNALKNPKVLYKAFKRFGESSIVGSMLAIS